MTQSCPEVEGIIELPSSAPQIRVTAGVGSAGQKTWNLRRPVTLLGSKRPAHIILHDRGVSPAHCAIINTGTDVLIFDLHTTSGTIRGKEPVQLAALQDGDVITLGESLVQVAIRTPGSEADDSNAGIEYCDPICMPNPATLTLMHTDSRWTLDKAVALIGRNELAAIRLDHNDVSARHALLFRFGNDPAIFDLGSRSGIWVNGQRRELSSLANGDRITVGPFGLQLQVHDRSAVLGGISKTPAPAATLPKTPAAVPAPAVAAAPATSMATPKPAATAKPAVAPASAPRDSAAVKPAAAPAERAEPLETNITEAWERLNQWRAQLKSDAAALNVQQSTLTTREAQLEARDAVLRGQLHDIQRFNEQLAERENELAAMAARVQDQADQMGSIQKGFEDTQAELQKKEDELNRREQALAQRWSRMQSTICPHCRKPVNLGAG